MAAVTSDFKSVESSYGDDVLHFVIASGYVNRLITNRAVEKYLRQRHPELFRNFARSFLLRPSIRLRRYRSGVSSPVCDHTLAH